MKLALALIVALQVSLCLCHVPDEDLIKKYGDLKATFLKRLNNAYGKAHSIFETLAEGTITGEVLKDYADKAKANERLQSAIKLAGALCRELEPLLDTARLKVLGFYGEHLRPHIGYYLDTTINNIKPVLDIYLPAE